MKLIIIIVILVFVGCSNKKIINIPNPNNFELIYSINGDIDFDGKDEVVVVFNTYDENAFGKTRLLQIYKKDKSKLRLWIESKQALKRSEEYGIKNNKVELEILNGNLVITNYITSGWQLIEKDTYRLIDGEFKLIDYKSKYGKDCEYWITVSYSPLSYEIEFIKNYENCTDSNNIQEKEIEKFKIEKVDFNLKNRTQKHVEFVTPNFKYEWSF